MTLCSHIPKYQTINGLYDCVSVLTHFTICCFDCLTNTNKKGAKTTTSLVFVCRKLEMKKMRINKTKANKKETGWRDVILFYKSKQQKQRQG